MVKKNTIDNSPESVRWLGQRKSSALATKSIDPMDAFFSSSHSENT